MSPKHPTSACDSVTAFKRRFERQRAAMQGHHTGLLQPAPDAISRSNGRSSDSCWRCGSSCRLVAQLTHRSRTRLANLCPSRGLHGSLVMAWRRGQAAAGAAACRLLDLCRGPTAEMLPCCCTRQHRAERCGRACAEAQRRGRSPPARCIRQKMIRRRTCWANPPFQINPRVCCWLKTHLALQGLGVRHRRDTWSACLWFSRPDRFCRLS